MSMPNEEEGPSDWEVKDEEPPERLQKKWDKEETSGAGTVVCPACKKETPADNLTCIFCESLLGQGSCPWACLFSWIKGLFKKG